MKQQWFDKSRLAGISDGVFAIAMTLLVLELKLPELEVPVSHHLFMNAVLEQLPVFLGWIISFAVLCKLWITQHALLNLGEKKSRGFTTVNFVFLGTISFIPFPTSLISKYPDQPLSVMVFSITYLVAWASLVWMWHQHKKTLSGEAGSRSAHQSIKPVIILMPVIAVISCLLAVFMPRLGILVWLIFPLAGRMVAFAKADKRID